MSPQLITIEDLFNAIKAKSRKERDKNKNFDGQKFWGQLKVILGNSLYKAKGWKHIRNVHYDRLMGLTEFEVNGHGHRKIDEEGHFAIKTVRIPRTEQPTLRKIMQVALNIGQFEGYFRHRNYVNAGGVLTPNNKFEDYISKGEGQKKLTLIMAGADIATLKKLLS